MQATPGNTNNSNRSSSTLKSTISTSTKLTTQPATSTFTTSNSFKSNLTKRTTTAAGAAAATYDSTTSLLKSTTSGQRSNLTASREIEEISKKISEHADAIYRTWKSRGLAPTELLDIYTNAATVVQQQHQQQQQHIGGDIFAGSIVVEAETENLQQFVNQFVLKDKEQRATSNYNIGQRSLESLTSARTATPITTTTTFKGNNSSNMPENIGNKIVGGGGGVGALKQPQLRGAQKTSILKPTSSLATATASNTSSSSSSLAASPSTPSTPYLMKTSNNNKLGEQTGVKKFSKSATSLNATTTPTSATPTSSSSSSAVTLKKSFGLTNVNSKSHATTNSSTSLSPSITTTSTTTATTPTNIKRHLGKTGTSSIATATPGSAATTILDLNLNLDFDDLQLVDDVNSLSRLQTQNLKKIKAFIKENEKTQTAATATPNPTITTKPKTTTSTPTASMTTTKIATKTKKPISTAKNLSEIDGVGVSSASTAAATSKLKASKALIVNEQIANNSNNNNNEVIKIKKIVKNKINSINTNNNNNNNNSHNEHNKNSLSVLTNNNNDDDATIHKLISTRGKLNQMNQKQQQQQQEKLDTKATTKTANKNSQVQMITSTTKNSTAMTPTLTPTSTAQAAAAAAAALKRNEIQLKSDSDDYDDVNADDGDETNDDIDDDDHGDYAHVKQLRKNQQKSTAASPTATKSNSTTKKVKKSIENDLLTKRTNNKNQEKINGNQTTPNATVTANAAPTLKAAIVETAAATLNVIEMAQKKRQNENSSGDGDAVATAVANNQINININASSIKNNSTTNKSETAGGLTSNNQSSNSNNTASNMPAPTKFKSGRTAPGSAAATQEKNLNRPFLTRGSVAERVLMFEKCPDVRNSFLNIKRPDPAEAPPKSLLKVKLHATPPPPPDQNRSLQQEIRSTKSVYIPRFYFPHGKPQPQIAQERTLRNILGAFDSFPNNQVTKDELPRILKLCGLPFYWRMPVMVFCQQQNNSTGLVERMRFVEFWKQMNVYCHDAASRFVYILSRGQRFRNYIMPEDLVPLVQDVVDTHPGLAFLKEATEFHSRYVHTVIARIFYSVNRSWSGKITMSELKKSDLLEIISLLEEEDDINQIMAFFSYEHFYVIYCKFWELDKDHDLLINQDDLARHSDHALSTRIVERIFSGCVTRSDKNKKNSNDDEPKMSYTDFVWFLLSEEDKRTPTAIEYWFRCMDLDGDGMLSMYELEYFYEEQQQRMESIGIETLPFEDCLCQMLDMIKPQRRDAITLGDLKRCKMTHVFFDTFFNLEKYLDHEQRDPFASQRDEYSSDWDRFAAQEYELLISEEND